MAIDWPAMIFPGGKEILVSGSILGLRMGSALPPKGSLRMSDAPQKPSDFNQKTTKA